MDAKPAGRVRSTRQGAAIDDALRAADGFRTAQDLHAELKLRGTSVGLTTVYRHLNTLAKTGAVDVVQGSDGEARFRHLYCAAGAAASFTDVQGVLSANAVPGK